jgi:hypothetical protein
MSTPEPGRRRSGEMKERLIAGTARAACAVGDDRRCRFVLATMHLTVGAVVVGGLRHTRVA